MSSPTQSSGDDSLQVFESTCQNPYDRHEYELVFKNGKKIKSDDYETIRNMWFKWCGMGHCDRIDVLDITPSKKKGGGGF